MSKALGRFQVLLPVVVSQHDFVSKKSQRSALGERNGSLSLSGLLSFVLSSTTSLANMMHSFSILVRNSTKKPQDPINNHIASSFTVNKSSNALCIHYLPKSYLPFGEHNSHILKQDDMEMTCDAITHLHDNSSLSDEFLELNDFCLEIDQYGS